MHRRQWRYLSLLLILAGGLSVGKSGYYYLKGYAAGFLINRAWNETRISGKFTRAWSRSNTYPVGKLNIPAVGLSQVVLEGATRASLAFGPAHIAGTTEPGNDGNIAIAGHRDSFFRKLEQLKIGDKIRLESKSRIQNFTVTGIHLAHPEESHWLNSAGDNRITLITCYPFNYLGNAPLRYIVIGSRVIPKSTESIERRY